MEKSKEAKQVEFARFNEKKRDPCWRLLEIEDAHDATGLCLRLHMYTISYRVIAQVIHMHGFMF